MAVLPLLNEGTGGLGTDDGAGPLSVWPGVASIVGVAWKLETVELPGGANPLKFSEREEQGLISFP